MRYLVKITLTNGEILKTETDASLDKLKEIFSSDSATLDVNNNTYMINSSHIVYLTYKELEE